MVILTTGNQVDKQCRKEWGTRSKLYCHVLEGNSNLLDWYDCYAHICNVYLTPLSQLDLTVSSGGSLVPSLFNILHTCCVIKELGTRLGL